MTSRDITYAIQLAEEIEALRPLFPGWTDELLTIYAQAWIETGDAQLAKARTEQSPAFARTFPGLIREDGSMRFQSAQQYLAARASFEGELVSIGINPEFFNQTFTDLLDAEVSVSEMLGRIETIYTQVIDRAPELRAFFALPENGGLGDLTDEALVASVLDPRIGEEIINRRIGIAQIGSAATRRNFEVDFDLIERLYEVGVNVGQAEEVFGQATEVVPILDVLARRHNDPDDDFDLNEFVSAQLLDDPFERRRMRRLLAQERASFTTRSVFDVDRSGVVQGISLGT